MDRLDCEAFDLRLADGTLYRIVCTQADIDRLALLIGTANIASIDDAE